MLPAARWGRAAHSGLGYTARLARVGRSLTRPNLNNSPDFVLSPLYLITLMIATVTQQLITTLYVFSLNRR